MDYEFLRLTDLAAQYLDPEGASLAAVVLTAQWPSIPKRELGLEG
jgi:hypothetical protein